MNQQLKLMRAIIRKDFLVMWPMVAVLFAMLLIQSDLIDRFLPTFAREWANGVSAVAAMLFILGVIHQDASASVRHDWLAKPISPATLLMAKVLFIATAIYVPAIAFDFMHQLILGRSLAESVLHATSFRIDGVAAMLAMILFAAVTSTLIEAAGAFVALFVMVVLVQVIGNLALDIDESRFIVGLDWFMLWLMMYAPILFFVPLLWVQYKQRRTARARVILATGSFTALLPMILGPDVGFAIQKAIATNNQAADEATVTVVNECFPHIILDADAMAMPMDRTYGTRTQLSPSLWPYDTRKEAGPGAIAFATPVTASGNPAGWKQMIGAARASYVSADGVVLHRLQGAIGPAVWYARLNAGNTSHFWLVPRAAFNTAQERTARLVLDYSMSLLEPIATAEVAVDAPRQYVQGLGYCDAKSDRAINTVRVSCFKRGTQPAMLFAAPIGTDGPEVFSGMPDYGPSIFELISGKSYGMTLRHAAGVAPTRVKVTAYEDRAHFNRQVVVPGLLGGSESACPAPVPPVD
jgi:hypothetical protein